jgi:hypothetical protein
MKTIYVIHKFGGDLENLDKALHWAAWLTQRFDALFVVPWVPLCRHWPDTGESRKTGIAIDMAAIASCHGAVAVGGLVDGKLSPGSDGEFRFALAMHGRSVVFDFSNYESPTDMEGSGAYFRLGEAFGLRGKE